MVCSFHLLVTSTPKEINAEIKYRLYYFLYRSKQFKLVTHLKLFFYRRFIRVLVARQQNTVTLFKTCPRLTGVTTQVAVQEGIVDKHILVLEQVVCDMSHSYYLDVTIYAQIFTNHILVFLVGRLCKLLQNTSGMEGR